MLTNAQLKKFVDNIPDIYKNGYGDWMVSTETDSGSKNLGIYRGYIDKIALYLANKACYGLDFIPAPIEKDDFLPTCTSVTVKLPCINLGSLTPDEVEQVMKEVFKNNRDTTVGQSQYYGGFSINLVNLDLIVEKKRQEALKKLTIEERKILGL